MCVNELLSQYLHVFIQIDKCSLSPPTVKDIKRTSNKTGLSTFRNRFTRQHTPEPSTGNAPSPDKPKGRIKRAATMVLGSRGSRSSVSFDVNSPLSSSPKNQSIQSPRVRNSTFFTGSEKGLDIASMFVHPSPGEVEPLNLNGLNLGEMMSLLHHHINELNAMVLPMTTGKAEVNMTVSV